MLGVTPLWNGAQWVSRAPPHNTFPAFLNLNGIKFSTNILTSKSELARSQQRVFSSLTDCWKSTMKECVKLEIDKVQAANQANLALLREVDTIDSISDGNLIFSAFQKSQNFPVEQDQPETSSISSSIGKLNMKVTKTYSSSDESSGSRNRLRFFLVILNYNNHIIYIQNHS